MPTVKKILCPTDFSAASKRAIELAVPIAEKLGAQIYLVHIVPVIPHLAASPTSHFDVPEYERLLKSDAEKQLSEVAKSIKGVKTHQVIGNGSAADGILKAADENQIDLIVIATAGATGLEHMVFGSVAEKVIRRASCPVLTIRPPKKEGK